MIKPKLAVEEVKDFVKKLTGIDVVSVKELNSYDDQNFLLQTKSHDQLVLKLSNSEDTQHPGLLEEINRVLLHLHNQGIKVPKPLCLTSMSSDQDQTVARVFIKNPPSVQFAVRIMNFLPGKLLLDILPLTPDILVETGFCLAQLTKAMSSFKSPVLEFRKTIWSLLCVDMILEILSSVPDEDNKKLVLHVIDIVKEHILSKRQELPTQVIHSDMNEANILVQQKLNSRDYEVSGIIDFDVHVAPRVFDLANHVLYMILMSDDMTMTEVGQYVLSGYTSLITLTPLEKMSLVYSMCGRLAQSLVLGAHASKQQPENSEYVLKTAIKGWNVLRRLLTEKSQLEKEWFSKI
jgi:hydroxylysine kinase